MPAPRSLTLAVALAATASLASAAPAHKTKPKRAKAEVTADVYGGYSHVHAGEASLDGWTLSGSYPLRSRLSVVGDLAGHYGSYAGASLSELALQVGVRHAWPSPSPRHGLSPFAEVLLGAVHTGTSSAGVSDSDTDLGLSLGGGADFGLSERWAARGLFHLRFVHGEGASDTDYRFSVGIVYRLR